jgi:hypothetical protein
LSFIRPILEYGNVIWDNCTQNEANLLESASFLIWQCMIFSFLSPMWKYLGEAFVPEFSLVLNILREGLDFENWFYSKMINGLTPDYMYDMIQPYTENIHDYNLRQQISGDNFRLPFCNTVPPQPEHFPID